MINVLISEVCQQMKNIVYEQRKEELKKKEEERDILGIYLLGEVDGKGSGLVKKKKELESREQEKRARA